MEENIDLVGGEQIVGRDLVGRGVIGLRQDLAENQMRRVEPAEPVDARRAVRRRCPAPPDASRHGHWHAARRNSSPPPPCPCRRESRSARSAACAAPRAPRPPRRRCRPARRRGRRLHIRRRAEFGARVLRWYLEGKVGFPDGAASIMPRVGNFSHRVKASLRHANAIVATGCAAGKLVETGSVADPFSRNTLPMRICIFGAGAVGSHFAVRLALAGHDVSCVMRGPHLEAVKANGLTLRVGDAEFTAQVRASDDPAALGPQDLVISTLKATALSQPRRPACRRCSATTPPWCSPRTAFPGGTISGLLAGSSAVAGPRLSRSRRPACAPSFPRSGSSAA